MFNYATASAFNLARSSPALNQDASTSWGINRKCYETMELLPVGTWHCDGEEQRG